MVDTDPPCLFAPGSARGWGAQVAAALGVTLCPLEERDFDDGEHKSRPLASVRGRDVYVLQSLYGDATHCVDEKLCRLLFLLGTLRDAAAARVTAVIPYLAYSRKDRRTQPRDPVSTRYLAQLLEAVGTDRVLTLDVHNLAAYQNAFRCRADHLEARAMLADHVAAGLGARDLVVVSPDAGGISRAQRFQDRLAALTGQAVTLAMAHKRRSGGRVSGELLAGDVAGRVAVIVDDLIGVGTTLARTARACIEHGAAQVHAVASHGLFVGDAHRVLADSPIASIAITDTVPAFRLPPGPVRDRLAVLPTAPLFARAITCMHDDGSITDLLADR